MAKINITVKFPWWVRLYIKSLMWFSEWCEILGFDVEPDIDKASRFVVSHSKIGNRKIKNIIKKR